MVFASKMETVPLFVKTTDLLVVMVNRMVKVADVLMDLVGLKVSCQCSEPDEWKMLDFVKYLVDVSR